MAGNALSLYDLKLRIIRQNLFGVDIDPFATNLARLRLWLSLAVEAVGPLPLPNLETKIETGDSLLGSDIGRQGGFDIVLGNPPYVDSHTMVKNQPEYGAALAARFSTAKGAWDLYVPFWERSLELLAAGGIATLITPNKWLSIGYGKAPQVVARHALSDLRLLELPGFQRPRRGIHRRVDEEGRHPLSSPSGEEQGVSEQIDVRHFSDATS